MASQRKTPLRAVKAGEEIPPAREIKSVLDATTDGTRMDVLIQMRKVIATALDSEKTLARDLASLSKRLMEIEADIATLQRQQSEEAAEDDAAEDEDWSEEAI